MTNEKILEIVSLYQRELQKLQADLNEVPYAIAIPSSMILHCLQMLDQIKIFVGTARIEKAFRWLGFVQGALWSHGVYSINELRNHSRSDKKKCREMAKAETAFSTAREDSTTLEQLIEEQDDIEIVVDADTVNIRSVAPSTD